MLFIASLLLVHLLVPRIVEELQYRLARGRQRAFYEVAESALSDAPLAGLSRASQLVSQRIAPSVVHISTKRSSPSDAPRDEYVFLYGEVERDVLGQGSGVIVDDSGEILTNYHVVRGAEEIAVTLSDDRRVSGSQVKVVGVDPVTDLALLRIEAADLTAATWGDSSELREGALVWAVGSPFGLSKSITFGILSAKDRRGLSGDRVHDFLQSDAAVSPGSSGGPLVNEQGDVVGINTAIMGRTYQGVSFAIPSRVAQDVHSRLRSEGYLPRGWLGVELDAAPSGGSNAGPPSGAMVKTLIGQPAREAGLRPGDIITAWDGHAVDSPAALSRLVAQTEVGCQVDVRIVRAGQSQVLSVEVGERPLQFAYREHHRRRPASSTPTLPSSSSPEDGSGTTAKLTSRP
jgi:S1-C subfamily serine protease